MKTIMVVVSFLFISSACFANGSQCVDLLTSEIPSRFSEVITVTNNTVKDGTLAFIDFFEALLRKRRVGTKELIHTIEGLNEDEIRNPIFIKDKETNSDSLVAYNIFQEYLDHAELNREKIQSWAQESLHKIEKVIGEKVNANKITKNSFYMPSFPIFSNIKSVDYLYLKFKTKISQKKYEEQLPIDHKYELMSTMVTQEHWIDYMKELPLGLRGLVNDRTADLDPDRAVTNVSWWSALEFANRRSEEQGLKPVYDFSEVDFKGSAEEGTLDRWGGELKINAPDGDILRSEGYRLPTIAEFNNILGKIKNKEKYIKQINELFVSATGQEGHFLSKNPWNVKGVVAITVDNFRFYDLFGLSREWLYSTVSKSPVSEKRSIYHYNVGDSESKKLIKVNSDSKHFINTGFRLVRTISRSK